MIAEFGGRTVRSHVGRKAASHARVSRRTPALVGDVQRALPGESQPELRGAPVVGRGDDAGGRVRNIAVRRAEVVVVEQVENLGPELDAGRG